MASLVIETLGLAHFCIRHDDPVEMLKAHFSISNFNGPQVVDSIDWNFIYKEDSDSRKFILFTGLNGWSYLIWKHWHFEANVELAKQLSETLQTQVNYYFVDSYIATSRWVFSENGMVTRAYYESHGTVLADSGFNNTELEIRKTISETFVEDVFWELYEKTCQSLNDVNKQQRTELTICTGNFNEPEKKV